MSSSISKLTLEAYTKFESGLPKTKHCEYQVQLNPENLQIKFSGKKRDEDGLTSASGMPVEDKTLVYHESTVSISFIIDNTGAIPSQPYNLYGSVGGSIKDSVDELLKATILPIRASHQPPFVKMIWGQFSLVGTVDGMSIDYTYFNINGDPVRASVSFELTEVVDDDVITSQFQSPDITRIVTVKDGDHLIAMCDSFYDDPKYYIEVAKFNNLPSFRGLAIGSKIEFPPLEK